MGEGEASIVIMLNVSGRIKGFTVCVVMALGLSACGGAMNSDLLQNGFWANGLSIWDVAAGLLIAQEAGALTSDFVGNPDVTDSDHYLCATPKCFKQMIEAIQPNFTAKEN